MNKSLIFFIMMSILLLGTLEADPIDRPVAMVKLHESEAVSQSQFRKTVETMEKQMNRSLSLEEKKKLLDQMINERLLIQAATKEKINVTDTEIAQLKDQTRKLYEQQLGRAMTDDEFKQLVEQTGYTWDAFMKELRKGILAQKYIKSKKGSSLESIPTPTEQEVLEYYYSNQPKFVSPEMVRFKQIFINPNLLSTQAEKESAKRKAQSVVREIRAGASFDNYWEIYDEGGRIKIGSLIPGVVRRDDQKVKDTFGKDFFDALFSLGPGEVSDLLVSKAGYHILTIIEKIPFKVLGIDDFIPPQNAMTVRTYVNTMLSKVKEQEVVQKVLDELLVELRRGAEIKVFEENLSW